MNALKRTISLNVNCAKKFEQTSGDTPKRRKLWETLRGELEAHASAEEQVFCSVMMKKPDGTEDARHSVHEHQEIPHQIQGIEEMDFSLTGWLTKF